MPKITNKIFNTFFVCISIVVLIIFSIRAYVIPLCHDEVATFFFYIQSGKFIPYHAHLDANNHVLNSTLSWVCYKLFGSHQFILRLPNLAALVILIYSTFQLSKYLKHSHTKILLTCLLLLSFHWLSFYNVTRGYGISMSCLLFAVLQFLNYVYKKPKLLYFASCLLFLHLAICSNLILIPVVVLVFLILSLWQLVVGYLLKWQIICLWLINCGILLFWCKFGKHLQASGALYYGAGSSYIKMSFFSLIQLIISYALQPPALIAIIIICTVLLLFLSIWILKSEKINLNSLKTPPKYILFFILFLGVIIEFYLLHKLFNINYPEDRTGLFFYLFFVLALTFLLDQFLKLKIVSCIISILTVIHFCWNINFTKHSLNSYETMPEHFYAKLLQEQKKSTYPITIGGHMIRELFYGYINYKHQGALNPMDPVYEMHMNCDYYIGTKAEAPMYKNFYTILDEDLHWGFTLLKRKTPLIRKPFIVKTKFDLKSNDAEFLDLYHNVDTTLYQSLPLQARVKLKINHIPNPANAWLVLSLNDSLNVSYYFKRVPLQWYGDNLNGKSLDIILTLGNTPYKSKNLVVFIWNINKKNIDVKISSLEIAQILNKSAQFELPPPK